MVSISRKDKRGHELWQSLNRQVRSIYKPTQTFAYTISEVIIVAAILGIISSIALPSSINLINRERMRIGMSELTSFIQNSRKSAILHSTSCILTISQNATVRVTDNTNVSAVNHCAPLNTIGATDRIDLRKLSGDNSLRISVAPCLSSDCSIGFSYKGTSLSSQDRTMIIESNNIKNHQRCLVITSPLGFVRTGFSSSGQEGCSYIKTS